MVSKEAGRVVKGAISMNIDHCFLISIQNTKQITKMNSIARKPMTDRQTMTDYYRLLQRISQKVNF